jgi:ADP-L-glycero-D-manno-heptose 6-epimerase
MIIVTGANGFIGSAIIWELNQHGHDDIICVDSVPLAQRPEALARRKYQSFLDKDEIWSYLKNNQSGPQKPTWILHMGACSSTTETNREFLLENNTLYTQRLFEWCSEYHVPLIYASSGATYGSGDQGFDDNIDPNLLTALNPYGESKLAFDRWVLPQTSTPPAWYGLRFFNVYGPGEDHKGDMASVVYKAFYQIQKEGELKLFRSHHPDYEDGKQLRDFVYVKDLTHWIWQLMNMDAKSGIYNMGYGKARTWLDLASSVFASMKREMKIQWIDMPPSIRNQYQYKTEAEMSKLMGQGLPKPQWSLEDGVEDYVVQALSKGGPTYL